MLSSVLADVILMWMAWLAVSKFAGSPFNLKVAGFYSCAYLLFSTGAGIYEDESNVRNADWLALLRTVVWATAVTGFALSLSLPSPHLPALLLCGGMTFCVLYARRLLSARNQRASVRRNVLIIGNSKSGQLVAEALDREPRGNRTVKQFLHERHLREACGPTMMCALARKECIDEVIVATQDADVLKIVFEEARSNRLDVFVVPYLAGAAALGFESVAGVHLLKIHEQRASEWALAIKRIADVALSATGLLVLSPFLALIALIIKLDSAGPVFYRAPRTGRKGHRFTCYKFRSMVPDADAAKERLRARNEREGAFFKITDDPRVTRAGRWLRRYSLDELPQLWNVLLGDMSLVGPRPHPPDDVRRYRLEHLQRLDFVPGITGLWQVTARRDPSFERAVALDVHYIRNWSLLLDLRILCRTVSAVIQGSGA